MMKKIDKKRDQMMVFCMDGMDPIKPIKIPVIRYLYGIRSMRQIIREQ